MTARSLTFGGITIALCLALSHAQDSAKPRPVGTFEDHADVGELASPGSAEFDRARNEYRVTAGGENIWGTHDAFHFVWRKAPTKVDEVSLSAEVRFEGAGKDPHRKACLMFRQGLEADDAYADVAVHGDGLVSLQYRAKKGGPTAEVKSPAKAAPGPPVSVRIARAGDAFTITVTPEGKSPAQSGPVTVPLRDPVYLGLAVSAHDKTAKETAVFSNVTTGIKG